MSFRLTYATMFDPPEAMHERFDAALATLHANGVRTHDLYINGTDVPAAQRQRHASPIDHELHLGEFPVANAHEANVAMQAAHDAFPGWRNTPIAERARLLRRVADVMEQRVYDIA